MLQRSLKWDHKVHCPPKLKIVSGIYFYLHLPNLQFELIVARFHPCYTCHCQHVTTAVQTIQQHLCITKDTFLQCWVIVMMETHIPSLRLPSGQQHNAQSKL